MENNLRTLRKARGLTQMKLAEKSAVHRSVIARFEIGQTTMSAKSLMKVARALDVSTDDILRGGRSRGATT